MNTILILSTKHDVSTTKVMRWIFHLNPDLKVIRLHPEDILCGKIIQCNLSDSIKISCENKLLDTDDIKVVWMRKWCSEITDIEINDITFHKALPIFKENLSQEFNEFYHYLVYTINERKSVYWLNKPQFIEPNKLIQLRTAQKVGLQVPFSFIATQLKNDEFQRDLITKPLSNCISFHHNHACYNNYTSRVNKKDVTDDFFMSYFQEEIKKEFELRVFYLTGQCYALAIFSQDNKKTEIDYRNYDYQHHNRLELYKLPIDLVKKIKIFMREMNLQTGSLDFIYNQQGEYIFLEVNPSGQYDIFNSCNIYPDKLIAELLIKHTS
jgi:ATP-GRASP peptide maturase of grasp-with-spasm system